MNFRSKRGMRRAGIPRLDRFYLKKYLRSFSTSSHFKAPSLILIYSQGWLIPEVIGLVFQIPIRPVALSSSERASLFKADANEINQRMGWRCNPKFWVDYSTRRWKKDVVCQERWARSQRDFTTAVRDVSLAGIQRLQKGDYEMGTLAWEKSR
ncbi:hypothetical protein CDAR_452031 [Caerostris darwini]|uniref:Uncharacterized protein n=1 Tax=Caerostris darwini TaxID=1538125 RepID=A0AAV4WM17_9ARAC|nr:hypothetical protein CDAR_452031 [Caerostris darwini]